MISFEELLEKGYSIEQVNQILLANEETSDFLKNLNTDTPVDIFREIRINFNSYTDEEKRKLFYKYSGEKIMFGRNPFTIHPSGVILGQAGSGKSFAAKMLLLKSILESEEPTIVTDPKGEMSKTLHECFNIKTTKE